MKIFIKIALFCVGFIAFLFIIGEPESVTLSNIVMKAIAGVIVWICWKIYYNFILSDNERKELDNERV